MNLKILFYPVQNISFHCIFFFVLFCVNSSCVNKSDRGTLKVVDIESAITKKQKIFLSQYTDKIKYVPLEFNADHPISWMYYLDLSDEFIVVSDGKSCLLYSSSGHFLRAIGKNGRGPGEYTFVNGVFIINEKIYVRDLYDLNEYNAYGKFLRKYKNCFLAGAKFYLRENEAVMLNDSTIFGAVENSTGQVGYKAIITDTKGKIDNSFKNFIKFNPEPGKHGAKRLRQASIYKFNNNVHFLEPYNDTLFYLDDQYNLIPEYVFNLGKFGEPLSERSKPVEKYDELKYSHINNVFQTKNLLLINCSLNRDKAVKRVTQMVPPIAISNKDWGWYNTTAILGIFDKSNDKLIFSEQTRTDDHLSTSGLYNDIDGGPRFLPDLMANDSTLIMIIQSQYIKEHLTSDDFKEFILKHPDKKNDFKDLADSLENSGSGNPVLFLVRFNK
jgi:hypothetical protein